MSIEFNENSPIWATKYVPKTVNDIILPDTFKQSIKKQIQSDTVQPMMLYGTPGRGKTTLAKAIAEDLNAAVMFINASLDTSINTIRGKVVSFISTKSLLGGSSRKVVILDECLEENEKVRIGTVDNWTGVPLNELERDVIYPVVSFNMETGQFENDTGSIISDREDDVYEVTLADGSTVLANGEHPFIIEVDGKFFEKTINEGLNEEDKVVKMV